MEILVQFVIFLIIGLILMIWVTPWWLCFLIAAVLTWGGILILDSDWI